MKQSLLPLAVSALLCGGIVHAQDAMPSHDGHNRLRLHFSKSSETDLVTVVVGDFQRSPENNYLVGATWGHDLSDTLFGLPFPMTWHSACSTSTSGATSRTAGAGRPSSRPTTGCACRGRRSTSTSGSAKA